MRMAVLVAASVLVAGCSGGSPGPASHTDPPATTAPATSAPATSAPRPGAAMADVLRWIEAGTPANPAGYHSANRDGEVSSLGDGVAFTTPDAEANCITNRYRDGALACLVKLAHPPPRPPDFPTGWKANWVDFPGATVDVGSPHGDPGPFIAGTGAELPAGQSLTFGHYRCRSDAAGLFCLDYAHHTAIAMSAGGVQTFGCLRSVTPPPDVGLRSSC